ncbi:MAG: NADH-quinone oxidoreductase subunit J [Anaerolineae bacterium]|jgi:NADH:ubiquinone oxidoreductase subunit 6 (subunit J)
MEILYAGLVFGAVTCAILAIRAGRLVVSSLWLAALSALLAVFFYLMDAARIAVIELSVGAGLVTVLLVFAIGIAGDEAAGQRPLVPKPISGGLGLLLLLLLGWFILPLLAAPAPASEPSLASLLWEGRTLDVWVQVVLIFTGVLGILGLLTESVAVEVSERKKAAQLSQVGSKAEPTAEREEIRL